MAEGDSERVGPGRTLWLAFPARLLHTKCMSFSRKALTIALALPGTACGSLTGAADSTSDSYLSLRVDPGPAINGQNIYFTAGDSLVIRASVIGDPDSYETPSVSAADPTMIVRRSDGSARVLRPATLALTATATAKSSRTRPAVLEATGTLTLLCQMYAAAGVTLTLVDSVSGAAPSGPGTVLLKVTDGTYSDSLRTLTLIGFWGAAFERVGTYTATVDADGYQPWRKDGIVVTRGLCHVRPVSVTARLVRR